MIRARSAWTLASVGLLWFVGCASEPVRPMFPQVESWDARPAVPIVIDGDERTIREESSKIVTRLEKDELIFDDERLRATVQAIVDRIAPAISPGGPKLRAILLSDSLRNAAALPDGTIILNVGLVAGVENEAELAMVVGHEIAHIIKRHSLIERRYREQAISFVDRMALSRATELEADRVGLSLVAAAGFDGRAAALGLDRLREDEPDSASVIPSWETHADLRIRRSEIASAARRLPKANGLTDSERFRRERARVVLRVAEIALDDERPAEARLLIERHLASDPTSGRAHYLRAEAARLEFPRRYYAPEVQADYERAVELAPEDPDALRALGLLLLDVGEAAESRPLLRRYLAARPDAVDRKLIERSLDGMQE